MVPPVLGRRTCLPVPVARRYCRKGPQNAGGRTDGSNPGQKFFHIKDLLAEGEELGANLLHRLMRLSEHLQLPSAIIAITNPLRRITKVGCRVTTLKQALDRD